MEEATWQAVILIPKGKKDYGGIGLVEVMWKLVADILIRPDHSLHHLPRLPPRILGGSWNSYRHPRGKTTSAVSGLELGGPVCDLTGPAQDV